MPVDHNIHRVIVRLQRIGGVDELRRYRIRGNTAGAVCMRTHILLDLLDCHGDDAGAYDDAVVESIDGRRLNGPVTLNATHDPWWFG